VSCYEVTPACTGNDALAMDGWQKAADAGVGLDLYRQHKDSTYTKDGSFYSLKVVKGNHAREYLYGEATYTQESTYERFAGRKVTFGCWVYSVSATNNVRLGIYDGSHTVGDLVDTADSWVWVEYTQTVSSTPTGFTPEIIFDGDAGHVAYISQPILVFGSSIGEGNYTSPPGEVIYLTKNINIKPKAYPLAADDGIINVEALSHGFCPKGVKALHLNCAVVSSAVATGHGMRFGTDTNNNRFVVSPPLANVSKFESAVTPCNSNGDLYVNITFSGDTITDNDLYISAIELR